LANKKKIVFVKYKKYHIYIHKFASFPVYLGGGGPKNYSTFPKSTLSYSTGAKDGKSFKPVSTLQSTAQRKYKTRAQSECLTVAGDHHIFSYDWFAVISRVTASRV
jgi:hypothetical protein